MKTNIIKAIAITLVAIMFTSCELDCEECTDIRVYNYQTNQYEYYQECRVVEC
jgi:hypothetical protein